MRLWFHSMNDIRKFDSILNEEYGNFKPNMSDFRRPNRRDKRKHTIIANDIPITLLRIEFNRKATDVTDSILQRHNTS